MIKTKQHILFYTVATDKGQYPTQPKRTKPDKALPKILETCRKFKPSEKWQLVKVFETITYEQGRDGTKVLETSKPMTTIGDGGGYSEALLENVRSRFGSQYFVK